MLKPRQAPRPVRLCAGGPVGQSKCAVCWQTNGCRSLPILPMRRLSGPPFSSSHACDHSGLRHLAGADFLFPLVDERPVDGAGAEIRHVQV